MAVWPLDFLSLKCMHSPIPNFTHLTSAPSTQSLSVSLTGMLFSCKKEENTAIYDAMMDLQIIKVK